MALDSIEGSLKERGVRLTRQRQILLELIDKSGEHLDAERLFQLAKQKDPKLNRVTVYRTIKMLKAGGLVEFGFMGREGSSPAGPMEARTFGTPIVGLSRPCRAPASHWRGPAARPKTGT